ncbi:hypothetical protein EYF80_049143 [Liparis tanakae]|uniref:Uncharacterized protein n=1 Tax=Liparis tanakae TaxID=230148 RepID=A0A4Z2FK95_9TELE|nr:hypothetical protein EYF80_049143 [Liparis tanakae]
MLRGFVNQRLTAAAQEICGLFERTMLEYEEELCRSKEETERHRKLLHAVFNPEVRVQRTGGFSLFITLTQRCSNCGARPSSGARGALRITYSYTYLSYGYGVNGLRLRMRDPDVTDVSDHRRENERRSRGL